MKNALNIRKGFSQAYKGVFKMNLKILRRLSGETIWIDVVFLGTNNVVCENCTV